MDRLDLDVIGADLEASWLWQDIVYRHRVESTNDLAKELGTDGALEGTVVVAEEQTAGRGRLGRRWLSPYGTSLLCSMLFRPALQPIQAHRLTMLCSMAAADAIEEVTDLSVQIKWPNDLIVGSAGPHREPRRWHKVAGILTESGLTNGHLDFVVVGIGVNVNVLPGEVAELSPRATSLLTETGSELDRSDLLLRMLRKVETRYAPLKRGENPHREWSQRLATLGQEVHVDQSGGSLVGVAEGVDPNGALLLRTREGSLERILAADVTLTRR